jgi:hypothetical protein
VELAVIFAVKRRNQGVISTDFSPSPMKQDFLEVLLKHFRCLDSIC